MRAERSVRQRMSARRAADRRPIPPRMAPPSQRDSGRPWRPPFADQHSREPSGSGLVLGGGPPATAVPAANNSYSISWSLVTQLNERPRSRVHLEWSSALQSLSSSAHNAHREK